MAAKTISILNNKGGVGKTISAAFIAEALSFFGKKVLLVDMDESANLSVLFNEFVEDSYNVINGLSKPDRPNIAEIFKYRYKTEEDISQCIINIKPNLDIIPSSKRHGQTPILLLQNQLGNNNIVLKKALTSIKHKYDFIIIDTAPANNILIVNTLIASDYILVPARAEGFSYKGLKETLETLSSLKEEYDIDAEFLGAFLTAAEKNTNIYKTFNKEFSETLQNKYLPCIRKDIKVSELITMCHDIIDYTSSSSVLYDYCMLLIATGILDDQTAGLIKKAYEENY